MTTRIFLLLMACHLLVSAGGVSGQVRLFTQTDEINNVNEYVVRIPSSRWESYTWEEHIRVRCYPSGELRIGFWQGGRFSEYNVNDSELLLKFDSEPPYTMVPNEDFYEKSDTQNPGDVYRTLTPRSKAKQHSFVRKLIAHNLLLVKQGSITGTTRFSLAGSAKAFAPIVSQCLGGVEQIESPVQRGDITELDVMLVIDTTDSMQFVIDALRSTVKRFVSCLQNAVPTTRVGIVAYRDFGEEYVTKVIALTSSIEQLHDSLTDLSTFGGDDWPEAIHEALQAAIDAASWSTNSSRVIILVPGSPPHPETMGGVLSLAQSFQSRGGVVSVMDLAEKMHADFEYALWERTGKVRKVPFKSTPLPGFYRDMRNTMSEIARAGGGEAIEFTKSDKLNQLICESITSYVTRSNAKMGGSTETSRIEPPTFNQKRRSGTLDHLPDVRNGNLTFLNTKASRFTPFVRRVAQRVFQNLLIYQRRNLKVDDVVAASSPVQIIAKLDGKGVLRGLTFHARSGSYAVDESLLDACQQGAWDEDPPPAAVSEDGHYHFIFRSRVSARIDATDGRGIETFLSVGLL